MKVVLSIALIILSGTWQSAALAADQVDIQEWVVPWGETRPRDPYTITEEKVWFVGQRGDYIAHLNTDNGEFTRFDLEPGVGPHTLIVDKDGQVWFAGNKKGYIGKLDPTTRTIKKYMMPDPAARDPHTMSFDTQGDIWFTVQHGNFIGKMHTPSGEVHLIPVDTPKARPYGLAVDSTGKPWIALLGTNKIATVDEHTMEAKEFVLPNLDSRPRRIGITSDDHIWYVDYARGAVGHLNPQNGRAEEWTTPGGTDSKPYGMAVDKKDRIWFVETDSKPNRFVGFDSKTKKFFSITEVESGGGTIRNMMYYAPSQEVWFGTDTNTVGRARVW